MRRITLLLIVALLTAAPQYCFSQYFQRLQDFDSTYDWGWDIFQRNDGNLFVIGGSERASVQPYRPTMNIFNSDGSLILSRSQLNIDSCNVYPALPGACIRTVDSDFILPLSIVSSFSGSLRSCAGLTKFNSIGDTQFLKRYTDTSIYYDGLNTAAISVNGRYVLGGYREPNGSGSWAGLLICTDTLGDTIWTHTYRKVSGDNVYITSIIPLPDGRIVIGAMSMHYVVSSPGYFYYYNHPWFITLDSAGNILKDTLYGDPYSGGGALYKDRNGGYIHNGETFHLVTTDPSDIENFPDYVAHLDTNFNIEWIHSFPYSDYYGHRYVWQVKQLQDNNFLLVGDAGIHRPSYDFGWLAKLNATTGDLLWTHDYYSDTNHFAYLRDAIEKPDGSIISVGKSYNDTTPAWHVPIGDIWLVGVDANGCEMVGCGPDTVDLAIAPLHAHATDLKIFPNPSAGNFNIETQVAGHLSLYTMQGQLVRDYHIPAGASEQQLPLSLTPGIYLGVFKPADGGAEKVIRLVYQP